jgi:hypothetical protein
MTFDFQPSLAGPPASGRRRSNGYRPAPVPFWVDSMKCQIWTDVMITKDFHYTKDFPLIRGKSFVIIGRALASPGHMLS